MLGEVNAVVDEVTGVIDELNVVVFMTCIVVPDVVVDVSSGCTFVAIAVEVWINSSWLLLLLSKVGVVIEVVSCLMIVLY